MRQVKIMHEQVNENITKLKEIYAIDKSHARVIFMNIGRNGFVINRLLYCYDDDNYSFILFFKKFGISTNCKMYSSQSQIASIIYKNKKFYIREKIGSRHAVRYLTFNDIMQFATSFPILVQKELLNTMIKKHPFIRVLKENELICNKLNINTIIKFKLFNLSKILKHVFKENRPACKILHEHSKRTNNPNFIKIWKEIRKVLINTELIRHSFLEDSLLHDTIKFAFALNKKINCKWSSRRLKEEHNKWSKEYNKIILEYEPEKPLNISQVFIDFQKFSGYDMPTTTRELALEGEINKNCVASYSSFINSGMHGIYHHKGCTIELKTVFNKNNEEGMFIASNFSLIDMSQPISNQAVIELIQIKSIGNTDPNFKIKSEVIDKVYEFNEHVRITGKKYGISQEHETSHKLFLYADAYYIPPLRQLNY